LEAILASSAVGLDPGLGIVHADSKGRQSFALDLIEPVRPAVEAFVLLLLSDRTLRKREFVETRDGHVRLMAPLTHELAETLPRWRDAIAPWAEKIAHMLGGVIEGSYVPATPLTSRRTQIAQAVVKARKIEASNRAKTIGAPRQRAIGTYHTPEACVDCGAILDNRRHVRCDACIEADPRQTPEIRSRRGQAIAARKRALGLSDPSRELGRAWYRSNVLPRLAELKLRDIMAATGYSKSHASELRRGIWTPHPSTWAALASLFGVEIPRADSGCAADNFTNTRM